MLNFVNPLFAWLALAAAIPLIIHLLNRRRYQQVRWAAMDFLLKALHKNRRRLRMESLILLLLRMLIVTVLAFVLAKPYLKGSVLFKEPDTHLVIAIDNSYSMGYRLGMSNAFEDAKKAAAGLMGQLKPEKGDKLSIITISGRPEILISESAYQMEQARSKLANLALSDYDTDISKMFALAREILNKSTSSRKIMYLVTDNQRVAWDKINTLKEKDILGSTPVNVIQVGPLNPGNTQISRVYTDKTIITARKPVTFYAEIKNYSNSDAPPGALQVSFSIQGQRYASSTAEIPGNNSVVVPFIHTFNEPGQYWVKIELGSDNLMLDDSRLYPVAVKDGINTVIINGEPGIEPSEDEILFLRYALAPSAQSAPYGTSGDVFSPYRIDTATATQFINTEDIKIGIYDLIIMANVEFLTRDKAEQLENFVRNGGGLMVFLGDRVNRAAYNELLYNNGAGLLPCPLGEVKGDPAHNEIARFGEIDLAHPALAFFSSIKERFNTLAVYQYYGLVEEGVTATVLARLNRPDKPTIIAEKTVGKGRVMVIGTSADNEWNLMPARPMYVMLVDQLAMYLASFRDRAVNRNLIVGEPIEISAESPSANYTLRLSKNDSISLAPSALSSTSSVIRYDTRDAGLYTLSGGSQGFFFAVNPNPVEGDLRKITLEELKAFIPSVEIFPAEGLDFRDNGVYPVGTIGLPLKDSSDLSTSQLWKYLLYILLVSVGLEMLLAWRFGRR
ncbi:MAG: BatA domain-containing protein [Planctomycetes bacterium]|nr:BatA domain-containing protein [Planctomycetota bacterium]